MHVNPILGFRTGFFNFFWPFGGTCCLRLQGLGGWVEKEMIRNRTIDILIKLWRVEADNPIVRRFPGKAHLSFSKAALWAQREKPLVSADEDVSNKLR